MLNATDGALEQGAVDVHVLSKAYLIKLGRCRTQSFITELTSDNLHKLHTALCLPRVSNPLLLEKMLVAILEAVPNEHVSRTALLSAGVSALQARLRDATLVRPSRKAPHTLLCEQMPGLLRDCAKTMGVKLRVKDLYRSQKQVRAEIFQDVEAHISDPPPVRDNTTKTQLWTAGRCQVITTIKDLISEYLLRSAEYSIWQRTPLSFSR